MSITRSKRRELDNSQRLLRSGKCLHPQLAALRSSCRSGRHCKQSVALVSANPDLVTEEAALEEPQRGEDRQGGTLTHEGIDLAEQDSQPTRTSGESEVVSHAEDVGIPVDENWSFVAAHEKRFCYSHGEHEWLLEYSDRWMSPVDFGISGAEVRLKKMLQDYQAFTSESHQRASPAECSCTLWSEVDTPVQHDDTEDNYLIRWKRRWTPESDIGDLEWVNSSYKTQNLMTKRRCSERLEQNAEARAAKTASMMVIFDLESSLAL